MSHVTRTLSRAGAVLVSAAVLVAGAVVPLAAPAAATTSTPTLSTFDARLLDDINHARTARGIRALTVVAGTTDVAHGTRRTATCRCLTATPGPTRRC